MAPRSHTQTPQQWRRTIVQYIADHPDRPLKPKRLAHELGISDTQYAKFRALVQSMLDDGTLRLGRGRALALAEQKGTIVGVLRRHHRGFSFIETTGQPDVFVRRGDSGDALDGDTVEARLRKGGRGDSRTTAQVVRVIERATIRWVGELERTNAGWFVHPHGKSHVPLVKIDDPTAKSARAGDMVVVEPLEHTLGSRQVRGVIIERLGDPGLAETIILSVMRRFGLPDDFPAPVRRAAQRAASQYDPENCGDRLDLRSTLCITIDPTTARDFDDAISLRQLSDGRIEVGVHIADVSFFVRPNTTLDVEARTRGTSVYFPGRVVPMLPEVLSNGVCSLQPDEPRLAKSVFITFDRTARPVETRCANSIIQSNRRLTYDEVTAVLEGRQHRLPAPIVELLRAAEKLARRIRERRLADGMITLALPEVEIELGKDGGVANAGPADTAFSHTVIEMFMVEANEAVSRYLKQAGLAHLRRIHPPPDTQERNPLRPLAAVFDRRLPDKIDRTTIRQLLDAVRGKPGEHAVNLVLLQAMEQAYYAPDDLGHFALASEDYCHFTSPIRRYPDLINHRLLDAAIARDGRRKSRKGVPGASELAELGRQNSASERRAQQAERDAKTLLLLELMESKVGQSLAGVVTGAVSAGVFVQVYPYLAEGLVHVSDFGPGRWNYDDRASLFVREPGGVVLGIGVPVDVVVAGVDKRRQTLDLVPKNARAFGINRPKLAQTGKDSSRKHAKGRRQGRRG